MGQRKGECGSVRHTPETIESGDDPITTDISTVPTHCYGLSGTSPKESQRQQVYPDDH